MSSHRILALQRFDTISWIMPYYAPTHKSFLLLSSLCVDTRKKLDEFYVGFVNWMRKYCISVGVESKPTSKNLFLPNDLFEMEITVSKINIKKFIKFMKNLSKHKGWYFGSNYMHSSVMIRNPLYIQSFSVKQLDSYIELMKSITVHYSNGLKENLKSFCQTTSLDTFSF